MRLRLFLLFTCVACKHQIGAELSFSKVADIDLPGGSTRFDYQDLDATHGQLVLAHMNDDSVVVVDLAGSTVVAEIADVPTARGVVVAEEVDRIFVTSSPDQLLILDSAASPPLKSAPSSRPPATAARRLTSARARPRVAATWNSTSWAMAGYGYPVVRKVGEIPGIMATSAPRATASTAVAGPEGSARPSPCSPPSGSGVWPRSPKQQQLCRAHGS